MGRRLGVTGEYEGQTCEESGGGGEETLPPYRCQYAFDSLYSQDLQTGAVCVGQVLGDLGEPPLYFAPGGLQY